MLGSLPLERVELVALLDTEGPLLSDYHQIVDHFRGLLLPDNLQSRVEQGKSEGGWFFFRLGRKYVGGTW